MCCAAAAEVPAHTGCAFSITLGTLRHWGGWTHLLLCWWLFQGMWFQALKCEQIILLQFCFSTALPLLTKSYLPLPFFLQSFYRETTHLLQGLSCQVLLTPTCHRSKPHLPITACIHKQGPGQRTRRVSSSSSPLPPIQVGQPSDEAIFTWG